MPTATPSTPAVSFYPLLLMMIAMACMPSGAALAKSLFPVIGAQGTAALRLLFSSLMLLAYFRPWRVRLTPAGWRVVLGYGVSLGMMNLLFYLALRTVPLGIVVALEFTGPLAVALVSSRRVRDFCWIGLAGAGIVLLIPRGTEVHALDPTGMLLALGAGLCWASYIVFGRRAGLHHGTQTVALASTIATAVVLPFGLAQAGTSLFAFDVLPWALGVAVLSSALPYALEIIALSRIPVRVFGTLLSLEPVFAAFSGMLFLRESLSLTQWAAIAAIVAASIGITVGNRPPARQRSARKRPAQP